MEKTKPNKIEHESVLEHQENEARVALRQSLIDDSQDEKTAVGTILHRCNHLYSLINVRQSCDKDDQGFQSLTVSIKRESKKILTLLDEFLVMKHQHNEQQHAIVKRLIKVLKKHK